MISEEVKSKLIKRYRKLAEIIIENNITEKDVFDIMTQNPEFQRDRDVIEKVSSYFEWRTNQDMPNVKCSTKGDISIGGKLITPVERGGELKVIISKGKTKITRVSAASLILSTFVPKPDDGVYIPHYRNQNYRDLRISNLYWYKVVE